MSDTELAAGIVVLAYFVGLVQGAVLVWAFVRRRQYRREAKHTDYETTIPTDDDSWNEWVAGKPPIRR